MPKYLSENQPSDRLVSLETLRTSWHYGTEVSLNWVFIIPRRELLNMVPMMSRHSEHAKSVKLNAKKVTDHFEFVPSLIDLELFRDIFLHKMF